MNGQLPTPHRVVVLVVALIVTACSTANPSASPAPPSTPAPSADGSAATPTPGPSNTDLPDQTSAPSAAPRTSPGPTPTESGRWRAVPTQESVLGTQFLDVVWTGSQFVAVGVADGGGVFVVSGDGRTWRSYSSGATRGQPMRVAAGPTGIVAIGEIRGSPSSWVSSDGLHWTWHRGAFSASLEVDEVATVTDVVATSEGWLAVGRVDPVCYFDCGRTPIRGLAWTSIDGITWARVRSQDSFAGGGMNSVASSPGGFVAVGTAGGHAAIWLTPDGRSWSRVPDDPIFAPPPGAGRASHVDANGVASGHGAIVAVGMAFGAGSGGAPVVMGWRSVDGSSWTAATVDGAEAGQVFGVATTLDRFLATGPSGEDSCLGGIWASTDGAAWSCDGAASVLAGFGPYAAGGSPAVEIVVGLTSAGWDESSELGLPGAVWWRPAR